MSHATLDKFGYPDTVIEDGPFWAVLLRPSQVTLGSLVLVSKEPVHAFSELSPEAFAALREVTGRMERTLHKAFSYKKINYLMLMMIDPEVHFHVIPRYDQDQHFANLLLHDEGWPGPPDLQSSVELDVTTREHLRSYLASIWC